MAINEEHGEDAVDHREDICANGHKTYHRNCGRCRDAKYEAEGCPDTRDDRDDSGDY